MNTHEKEYPSDEQIRQAIRQALPYEAGAGCREIATKHYVKATVGEGYVILNGSVGSRYERHAVESVVRPIPGVRGILNKIQVQPDPSSSVTHQTVLNVSLVSQH